MTPELEAVGEGRNIQGTGEKQSVNGWAGTLEEVGLWWGLHGIKRGVRLSLGGFLTGRKAVEKEKKKKTYLLLLCSHFLK